MNDEQTGRMPPAILMRSFLMVGGGYILSSLAFVGSIWLVSRLFFPAIHELFNDSERLVQVMATAPEEFYTRSFFWALLLTNVVANAMIGFAAALFAPFAKFPHAVFIAITVFIYFMQQSLTQDPAIQWMFASMMFAFPIAIMFGAHWGIVLSGRQASRTDSSSPGE